jgi:hypothetical protein
MASYFKNFPLIEYNGRKIRDITRRSGFNKSIASNPYLYMPYTVSEGERAEDIADFYYGSVDYIWLVYLSNNIIDPYLDWTLSAADFNNYLIEKYADESGLTGDAVVDWTRQETFVNEIGVTEDFTENIIYYYKEV